MTQVLLPVPSREGFRRRWPGTSGCGYMETLKAKRHGRLKLEIGLEVV